LCGSRKYPYSPHRKDWNFLRGGGFYETKKLKKGTTQLAWVVKDERNLAFQLGHVGIWPFFICFQIGFLSPKREVFN